jgi:hypothetical protein
MFKMSLRVFSHFTMLEMRPRENSQAYTFGECLNIESCIPGSGLSSPFLMRLAGGDGRSERIEVSELRAPALDLRPVHRRVGQTRRVGHQQQRLLRQRPLAHPGTIFRRGH